MTTLDNIIARALVSPAHIVLAEGDDPRVVEASVKAVNDGLAQITLLGNEADIRTLTRAAGDGEDNISVKDGGEEPLNTANQLVVDGKADGTVAGAVRTTRDVVRSAIKIIGVAPGFDIVSSFFIMIMPEDSQSLKGGVIYSDSGLLIEPDADQLAEIASASADNARTLLGLDPRVAFLSFATKDSAEHPFVDKVNSALEKFRQSRPDVSADGPLQFDAAILPDIAARKAPGSDVAGHANVFIFPDLNAGNIAYKITERLCGAKAIGPILQGLARPANDLSRGCSAEDIYNMIAITVLQAQAASS